MKNLLFLTLLLFCATTLSAQEPHEDTPFSHFGIGLRLSTLGAGVELSTNLGRNFQLRAGYNYVSVTNDYKIDIDDDAFRSALGYNPILKTEGGIKLAHAHVLLDIHPLSYGIFHFTMGAYVGNSKVTANGQLTDKDGQVAQLYGGAQWPTINLDKYAIEVGNDAKVDAALHLGNVVKPYLGIGIGRSLPNKRLGFMVELGAMYQGDLYIKQNGKKLPELSNISESFADAGDYTKFLKWYPMLNFQLTYRLF